VADAAGWALRELERGATSLLLRPDAAFRLNDPSLAGCDGIRITGLDDLDAALNGVYLDLAPLYLEPGAAFGRAAELLVALWERRSVDPADARGGIGADPIGSLATTGELADDALSELAELTKTLSATHPNVTVVAIDSSVVAEAGASPVQELTYLLGSGAAYLRALAAAGVPVDTAVRSIELSLTTDTDVFGSIAKLRAARRVWAHLATSCGASDAASAPRIHVRTAQHMMTRRDPWVNLLRVTAATFAAGVGGAESVITLPFDSAVGESDELGRRMARNTQVLLQEESHIGRVIDPAGGSWYIESLTDQLAAAAWSAFGELESAGGVIESLASGSFGEQIAAVRTTREGLVATRRAPITGVSEFPDIDEVPLERPAVSAVESSASGHLPLPTVRWSAPFEALRDAADSAALTGTAPAVFLVNLGPVAVHTGRATFAKNFFEAGGIASVTSERGGTVGFTNPADAVADLQAADAKIVCICSSDAIYGEQAQEFASALRSAGVSRIYLAGNPGERREAELAAGVDEFVHIGVNVLDVLTRAHQTLGTVISEANNE
jgi:methylmalonyl-CoA mutase